MEHEQVLLLIEKAADDLVDIMRAAQAQNDVELALRATQLYEQVLELRPTRTKVRT